MRNDHICNEYNDEITNVGAYMTLFEFKNFVEIHHAVAFQGKLSFTVKNFLVIKLEKNRGFLYRRGSKRIVILRIR